MKDYAFYSIDGVIRYVSRLPDDVGVPIVEPGLQVVALTEPLVGPHIIVNGIPVVYVPPLPTLTQLKTDKWEQIKTARTAAIDAPLTTPYGVFDSYAEARSNITDAVLLAQTLAGIGQAVAINYTLADNSVVTLDLTKMVTVGLMLGSKVQTVRGVATGLRTQIDAATTSTQLDAIAWPI